MLKSKPYYGVGLAMATCRMDWWMVGKSLRGSWPKSYFILSLRMEEVKVFS
jgi:hypothetical protein